MERRARIVPIIEHEKDVAVIQLPHGDASIGILPLLGRWLGPRLAAVVRLGRFDVRPDSGRWKLNEDDEFPGPMYTVPIAKKKVSGVFRLNRSTSAWERVEALGRELYGADGDKLVFAQWPDGIMH